MKLYHAPASPFVRKVMVLLHEAESHRPRHPGPGRGHPARPRHPAGRPQPAGQDPRAGTPDGPTLYDSRVITRYLDDLLTAGLYPATPRLWDTLVIEATGDGIAEAAVLMRYEMHVRPEASPLPRLGRGAVAEDRPRAAALEERWMSHLSGPLDMGQIAVACALGYLDFRHAERDWRALHPGLAAWHTAFAARPAMLATAPGA
jgi:glutathione S-transferase